MTAPMRMRAVKSCASVQGTVKGVILTLSNYLSGYRGFGNNIPNSIQIHELRNQSLIGVYEIVGYLTPDVSGPTVCLGSWYSIHGTIGMESVQFLLTIITAATTMTATMAATIPANRKVLSSDPDSSTISTGSPPTM